jgi:ABC-type transport system involved in multi-copper enzyme maturation permease subunit
LYAAGLGLCLIQLFLAVPWLVALTRDPAKPGTQWSSLARAWPKALGGLVLAAVVPALALAYLKDRDVLITLGRIYGAVLNLQFLFDVFVIVFAVLLLLWPRGAAVALAAFREGIRQPMFWFIFALAAVMMIIMPFLPYFTFGEDLKMVRQLGYDTIMLSAALFGVLAASMSISEEIEGRTAITLMSKPVSRRQFLLGKFAGIMLASLFMTGILSMLFFLVMWFKPVFDRDDITEPIWVDAAMALAPKIGETATNVLAGAAWWLGDAVISSEGLVLGFCQVTVILAIAVALATRLPMVVNLVICLVVFFLGHLTPVLSQVSQGGYALVRFMAQLFDTLLPSLERFDMGPAMARDAPPPLVPMFFYLATVVLYATVYTAIALLFGLILFEDRDLA